MAIAELNGLEIQKGPNRECLGPRKCWGLQYLGCRSHEQDLAVYNENICTNNV
jgi:hypothetical protein